MLDLIPKTENLIYFFRDAFIEFQRGSKSPIRTIQLSDENWNIIKNNNELKKFISTDSDGSETFLGAKIHITKINGVIKFNNDDWQVIRVKTSPRFAPFLSEGYIPSDELKKQITMVTAVSDDTVPSDFNPNSTKNKDLKEKASDLAIKLQSVKEELSSTEVMVNEWLLETTDKVSVFYNRTYSDPSVYLKNLQSELRNYRNDLSSSNKEKTPTLVRHSDGQMKLIDRIRILEEVVTKGEPLVSKYENLLIEKKTLITTIESKDLDEDAAKRLHQPPYESDMSDDEFKEFLDDALESQGEPNPTDKYLSSGSGSFLDGFDNFLKEISNEIEEAPESKSEEEDIPSLLSALEDLLKKASNSKEKESKPNDFPEQEAPKDPKERISFYDNVLKAVDIIYKEIPDLEKEYPKENIVKDLKKLQESLFEIIPEGDKMSSFEKMIFKPFLDIINASEKTFSTFGEIIILLAELVEAKKSGEEEVVESIEDSINQILKKKFNSSFVTEKSVIGKIIKKIVLSGKEKTQTEDTKNKDVSEETSERKVNMDSGWKERMKIGNLINQVGRKGSELIKSVLVDPENDNEGRAKFVKSGKSLQFREAIVGNNIIKLKTPLDIEFSLNPVGANQNEFNAAVLFDNQVIEVSGKDISSILEEISERIFLDFVSALSVVEEYNEKPNLTQMQKQKLRIARDKMDLFCESESFVHVGQ